MFTLTKPDDSHLISAVTTQSTNNVGQKTTIQSTEVLSDVIKSRTHSICLFRIRQDFDKATPFMSSPQKITILTSFVLSLYCIDLDSYSRGLSKIKKNSSSMKKFSLQRWRAWQEGLVAFQRANRCTQTFHDKKLFLQIFVVFQQQCHFYNSLTLTIFQSSLGYIAEVW